MIPSTTPFYDSEGALRVFMTQPLFQKASSWLIDGNPFRRPVLDDDANLTCFSDPLTRSDYFCAAALTAHRLLMTINHGDFVFLPDVDSPDKWQDFTSFYAPEMRIAGEILRPIVERFAFGAWDGEIATTDSWTVSMLQEYFLSLPKEQQGTESKLVRAVLDSPNPARAAKNLLIQYSVDFLTEGSSVARKVMGNFGEVQSNLFRIFMDEYGNGIHPRKHSSLYESLLRAHHLSEQPYRYWQYLLISSFALPNFLQYLAVDHRKLFRYIGAVYYAETTYYHISAQLSAMLKQVFGNGTETAYFDEHFEVDQIHSQIAYENLVCPVLQRFGSGAVKQVLQGYEEVCAVGELGEDDFIQQLDLMDRVESFRRFPHRMSEGQRSILMDPRALVGRGAVNAADCLPSRINDMDVVYLVKSGRLQMMLGHECVASVEADEGLVIPRGRLHAIGASDTRCCFEMYRLEPSDMANGGGESR